MRFVTFEQVMTVVAVGATPVGVALGWGLSQLSESRRDKKAARERTKQENADRAVRLLAAAAAVEADGRTVINAAYDEVVSLKVPSQAQLTLITERLNLAMRDLDRLALEAELFGPKGLAEVGSTLRDHGQELVTAAADMQLLRMEAAKLAAKVNSVREDLLPAFAAAVVKAMGDVRDLLDASSKKAPAVASRLPDV